MASLAERISLIVRSKASNLVSMFEDPAEVIDQVIIDAKKDYAKVIKESVTVFANRDKAKDTLEEYKHELDKWNGIAEQAVLKDRDDHATRALEHVEEYERKVAEQEERCKQATAQSDALRKQLNEMEDQIKNMEGKSADIKADMANAKAAKTTAKISGKIGSNKFAEFDRLAEKAAQERREAEAFNELQTSTSDKEDEELERLYGNGASAPVSDRLAELRKKLGK